MALNSESVSNNRVKSGYENRKDAPINLIPDAGARAGTANGRETTEASIALPDNIEEGQRHPGGSRRSQMTLTVSPQGHDQAQV